MTLGYAAEVSITQCFSGAADFCLDCLLGFGVASGLMQETGRYLVLG